MTFKVKLPGILISMIFLTLFSTNAKAQQTSEELINLLISKNVITQLEADSVRAVIAIKAQDDKAKLKKFNITSGKVFTINGYTQLRFQSLQESGKKDGFDVVELNNGSSNTAFSWSVTANRKNEVDASGNIISRNLEGRFAPAPLLLTKEIKTAREAESKKAEPAKRTLKAK